MLHTQSLLAVATCASLSSAQSNISISIAEMLDLVAEELLASPNIDTRLSPFEYSLQKNKKVSFFRTYFEGFEFLRLEGRCSTNNNAQTIECLVRFPFVKVIAYGNLEGVSRPLIQLVALVEDLLYVLELNGNRVSKFHAATDPNIEFIYEKNPFQAKWEKEIHPKFSEWIHRNFIRLVDWYVKPKLSQISSRGKTP